MKKILTIALVLCLLATALAGCGSSAPAADPTAAPTEAPAEAAAEPTAEPTAEPAAEAGKLIVGFVFAVGVHNYPHPTGLRHAESVFFHTPSYTHAPRPVAGNAARRLFYCLL